MKAVIYTSVPLDQPIARQLSQLPAGIELSVCRNPEEAAAELADAEALLIGGRMSAELLEQAPRLRWIQTFSAGVDHLPLEAISRRGIILTDASGIHRIQMAEYAIWQMLNWVRRGPELARLQAQASWNHRLEVGELHGSAVGIVGAGEIGRAVARKARAFDMTVLAYNRSGSPVPEADRLYTGRQGLHELLAASDFVVVALPLTPETNGLIGSEELRRMKPGAFLVNLARGSVVRESDLIAALRDGTIAGAGLDVFEREPLPPESPLWRMPNVVVTPHIAGSTPHYHDRALALFRDNLERLAGGRPLRNVVSFEAGY